jgi:hypothetical protein
MPDIPLRDDPPLVPPVSPGDDECCRNGCDPCVWDLYAGEMERYREALKAWEERQKKKKAESDAAG